MPDKTVLHAEVVFDILVLAGRDLTRTSLEQRRALLQSKILPKLADPIRASSAGTLFL